MPQCSLRTVLLFLTLFGRLVAATPEEIKLWPDRAPGEVATLPPEGDTTKPTENLIAGKRVARIGNVSSPTLTLYRPAAAANTGAAVLVCPGGGYNILAVDLEGTEVCEWLNSIGVTAALLKYRVPRREGQVRHGPPLQDAQRALGLLRQRANELQINSERIGVLGFSAGGHLAAMLSNHHDTRTYPRIDAADELSCRPNFCVLIYPGYLTTSITGPDVSPDLKVKAGVTPPTFLAMTEDDPVGVENPLFYYLALKQAKVPAELHLYPTGGHGYGLRRTKDMVTTWPDRVADWMKTAGWLEVMQPK
ncbi:MAG: alpha/beta hydrolase [Opitutus sp.]